MGLLNFNGITKYFDQRLLLREISFSVERGERLALIGPNGSGKTTLVRIAMGELSADEGGASTARGVKAGFLTQDLSGLRGEQNALMWSEYGELENRMRELETRMEHAPPEETENLLRSYEKLTTRFEAMDGYTIKSQLKATLLGLGLREEALYAPLERLSSGERMRVALARILLKSPDLLVLDEPTNHLDVNAVMWLEQYLNNFSGGVLVVSHDRYFLDRVTTRLIELRNTSIVVHHGNYSSFLQQQGIRGDFLRDERARLDREITQESELARRLRASAHITQAKSREKKIERLKQERADLMEKQKTGHLGRITAPGLNLKSDGHESAEVAVAENAGKRFGDRVLFEKVNFLIRGGERVAFVGPNGCGKTTLLRILMGLDGDYDGRMTIGSWVKIGILDQNAVFEDEQRSMIEEVMATKPQTEPEAKRILSKVGFYGDETYKKIHKLSGGERVRLKLALLLLAEPRCLVLDEPTNHLDLPAREAVEQAIADYRGSVIAVSHDRYFLNRCVTRILAFEGTQIRSYEGNWDDYQAALAARVVHKEPVVVRKSVAQVTPSPRPVVSSALIEAQIQMLEAKKEFIESLIGPDAKPSVYDEYAKAMAELEELYEAWANHA